MIIGIPRETGASETRSAMVPDNVRRLTALGATLQIEAGTGQASGFSDADFAAAGATVVADRNALLAVAEVVLRVRKPPLDEVDRLNPGSSHISFLDPFNEPELIGKLAARGVSAISLE